MNVFSRRFWIGALTLLLITSSCNLPAQTPPPVGTIIPTGLSTDTRIPTMPSNTETPTDLIPVTGMREVALQCQFCVNDQPHAVLILPVQASFLVAEPVVGINCITAQVVNEKRILFCRGDQQTPFTLSVCFENTSCLQYPITLETCPMKPQTANPTPVILTPIDSLAPTEPVNTVSPPATATLTPLSTAIATTAPPQLPSATIPPVIATTASPSVSMRTPFPATRLPRTSLQDPEGFVRWYFETVWRERDFQDLWTNYLTESFRTRTGSSNYEDYAAWWNSVQRVDVNSVQVMENNGSQAWVRVNVTFTMVDGRVISNQEYDYDLLFDPARQTWMFDYHP